MRVNIKKHKSSILFISLFVVISFLLFYIFRSKLNAYPDSTFRNILEIIYFIANSSLLVVGLIGLKQLRIAKESSKMNARRESFKLAAEQCTHFLNYIIPLINDLDVILMAKSINDFGKVKITIKDKKILFKNEYKRENFGSLTQDEILKLLTIINALEAFSVFFTQRVAEDEVGFSTVGQTYYRNVSRFIPLILNVSDYGERGYSNIIKLYIAWSQRIEKQNALSDKLKAEKKLNESVTINFNSLGT